MSRRDSVFTLPTGDVDGIARTESCFDFPTLTLRRPTVFEKHASSLDDLGTDEATTPTPPPAQLNGDRLSGNVSPTSSASSRPHSARRNTRALSPAISGLFTRDSFVFSKGSDDEISRHGVFANAEKLGQGTEGCVYRVDAFLGEDCTETMPIAVKVFDTKITKEQIQWQVLLTAGHHSSSDFNLLKPYDADNISILGKKITGDHKHCLFMPVFDITLDKLFSYAAQNPAEIDTDTLSGVTAHCLSDILIALKYMHTFPHAHGVGVAHRDLKPENIALKTSGVDDHVRHFVLFDITTAQPLDKVDAPFAGTAPYMHPGCFIEGDGIPTTSAKNDLYQLGMSLLEMLGKTSSTKPGEKSNIFRMIESKEAEYKASRDAYEKGKARKIQPYTEMKTDDPERVALRLKSGLFQINLRRAIPGQAIRLADDVTVYPTLRFELSQHETAQDKLNVIAKHLTRCFEQPNIDAVIAAVEDIQKLLLASTPDLPERMNDFYENAVHCKSEHTPGPRKTLSFVRRSEQSSPGRSEQNSPVMHKSPAF